jgi:hypothetical protein
MMNRLTLSVTLAMALISAGVGYGADLEVKAYVDLTTVGLNQQFTLSVEISGQNVNSAGNPELPKMDEFAAYLGSGTSQNMQFVNGRMSVSHTTNFYFQSTKEGNFEIGAVVVKAGGKEYRTDPIAISIQKTAASSTPTTRQRGAQSQTSGAPSRGDLFIRALVTKRQVYQNEPVILTYKIYTRVNVSSFGFTSLPGTAGFWVEEFNVGQQPRTSTEVLDGKQYTVATIKQMALFPMSAGTKTIDPLGVECEVRVRSRRSRDIFDDFFNDSVFGRTMRHALQSPTVKIDVLPLPEEGKPSDFSGIVGSYTLNATVDKSGVKTNEAISYKVTIEGQGNIKTLPEPVVSLPSDFEAYPPKVSESINRRGTVSGSKTYEYVLIPRVAGRRRIAPVQISVFDLGTKAYRTLTTDAFVIDVEQGDETYAAIPSGLSREEVRLLGQDIRFIKTMNPGFRRIGTAFYTGIGFWVVFFVPLILLGCSFGYRRHQNRMMGDEAFARDRTAGRSVRKRLASAKSVLKTDTQKEFYAEIGKALMGFLGDKLNIAEAGMVTDDVRRELLKRNVKDDVADAYFDCLSVCDMKRFSPSEADDEEMKALYKRAEEAIVQLDKSL